MAAEYSVGGDYGCVNKSCVSRSVQRYNIILLHIFLNAEQTRQ